MRSKPSRPAIQRRPTAPNQTKTGDKQAAAGLYAERSPVDAAGRGDDAGPSDLSQRYDVGDGGPSQNRRRRTTNSGRERRRPTETNDDTTPAAVDDGKRVKTHLIWSIANEQRTRRRQSPRASTETKGDTAHDDGQRGVYRHAAGFSVMCAAWRMLLVVSWPGDSSMASLDFGPPTAAVGFCSITAGRWLRGGACDTMS